MSKSPTFDTSSEGLVEDHVNGGWVSLAQAWTDLLPERLTPVQAALRMATVLERPVTILEAQRGLDAALKRQRRLLRSQQFDLEETRAELKADGLGKKLQGMGRKTDLYRLIMGDSVREHDHVAEIRAEMASDRLAERQAAARATAATAGAAA